MPALQLWLTISTVLALAIGQILFKLAAAEMDFSIAGILPSLMNLRLLVALGIYGIATLMWLAVLKSIPLQIAYPFTAITYVCVQFLAYFILGEELHRNTFIGGALIFVGVWISMQR